MSAAITLIARVGKLMEEIGVGRMEAGREQNGQGGGEQGIDSGSLEGAGLAAIAPVVS